MRTTPNLAKRKNVLELLQIVLPAELGECVVPFASLVEAGALGFDPRVVRTALIWTEPAYDVAPLGGELPVVSRVAVLICCPQIAAERQCAIAKLRADLEHKLAFVKIPAARQDLLKVRVRTCDIAEMT